MMIEVLKSIVSAPKFNVNCDWNVIENDFKIIIPIDFKKVVEAYGSGCIDDFLWILNPFSENQSINFLASRYFIESYLSLKNEFPEYFIRSIFPEDQSFFPWCVTDNGETFNWIIDKNKSSDEWKVAIFSSDQTSEEVYDMSATELLIKLLSKEIISKILPDDFPSNNVLFNRV